ncbi:MAG TPA: phosphatidylglycerol lysyltransferase domain-containing protein [Ktedonobacterales bacterium]
MKAALRTLAIYLVALVNIGSTLLPVWPRRFLLLTSVLPVRATLAAQYLTLCAGALMLLLASPAARGHRRAAWTLMACALLATIMNLAKGLDVEEALLNLLLLVGLFRARHRLHNIPLRYTVVDLVRLGVGLLTFQALYALSGRAALAALMALEDRMTEANGPLSARRMRLITALTAHLPLERFFLREANLALPVFLLMVFVVMSWTALARIARDPDAGDLYLRFGRSSHNSLAYLANRGDTRTFLSAEGRGVISFKLVGRVALQIGAALGSASEREGLYVEYRAWLREERLIPAAVALSREERAAAVATGMRAVPIGREAVVPLATFAVDGLGKKMRWARRSLGKRGYHCEILSATEVTGGLRAALGRIDAEWQAARGGKSYGCCMTLGRFPHAHEAACLVGLMRDPQGEPVAYLTLLPGGEGVYSLDLTRRRHSAPNAAMEFLLMETLEALRARGASEVSLNFSTFSGAPRRAGGRLLARVGGLAFQTRSLETFNNKFLPQWAPRYLALRSWLDLPDVVYAILVVEGADRALSNATAHGLARLRARWMSGWRSDAGPADAAVSARRGAAGGGRA